MITLIGHANKSNIKWLFICLTNIIITFNRGHVRSKDLACWKHSEAILLHITELSLHILKYYDIIHETNVMKSLAVSSNRIKHHISGLNSYVVS